MQWNYCSYAQEKSAGIYCAVSIVTNNTKPMYKVGEVTHAALNMNRVDCSTVTCREGPANIYLTMIMMMIMNTEYSFQ